MQKIANYQIQEWLFSTANGHFDIDLAESGIHPHHIDDIQFSKNYVSCHNRRVSACHGARTNPSRARKQAEFSKKLQNISKSLLTRFFRKTDVFSYQP